MIPKNLIQFWHDKSEMPGAIRSAVKMTCQNNQGFRHIFADDVFVKQFIRKNYAESVLNLYQRNRVAASRSDIARLMLLYEYGGYYVDAAMEVQKSLNDISDESSTVLVVIRDDAAIYARCPEKAHTINGILAASPKSPFIQWCILRVLSSLAGGEKNKFIVDATGPRVLDEAFSKFKRKCKIRILSFSSLENSFFIYRRVEGINNSWVCKQRDGIISPLFYNKYRWSFKKLWMGKRFMIRFSFTFLRLPK